MLRVISLIQHTQRRRSNKGQGHSFWQATNSNRCIIFDILQAVNSNFCSRTHRLATIHSVQTTDRRTQHCSINAIWRGQLKMKHFRCEVYSTMCHMGRSFWSQFGVNRSTFDEDVNRKLFTFSFTVTLTFDPQTSNLLFQPILLQRHVSNKLQVSMAFLFPENRMQTDAGKTAAIAAGDCKLRRRSGQLTDVAVIFVAKVSSH